MIQTNLLGRKIHDWNKNVFTIVGIYLDRGAIWFILLHPEGGMHTATLESVWRLLPDDKIQTQ